MKNIIPGVMLAAGINLASAQTEPPAISQPNRNSFFIAETVLQKYNLQLGQNDEYMKVYNNESTDAPIQRVNDIRWQATDKDAAISWYRANTKTLSEDGRNLTYNVNKPVGVDEWNVYGASEANQKMMEALGLKSQQFCFTFTVDQYIAKIFIAAAENVTVQDAWVFAKEGLRATLDASGKKLLAGMLQ